LLSVVACVPDEWNVEAKVTVTVPVPSASVIKVKLWPATPGPDGVHVEAAEVPFDAAMT